MATWLHAKFIDVTSPRLYREIVKCPHAYTHPYIAFLSAEVSDIFVTVS